MTFTQNRTNSYYLRTSGNAIPRIVPSNVLESTSWDLLRALGWIWQPDVLGALRSVLQEWMQNENIFFSPSGECAIAQILSLLPQNEVVMPAWICDQVKIAAKIAGKRIIFVDLAKGGINATSAEYDEAARPGRILLIAHLFGVPTDVAAICELAKRRGCPTIEDSVAAVGARQDRKLLGTFGDFGVFSFEQSKRLTAFRGGYIVANNEHLCDLSKLQRNRVVVTTQAMPYLCLAKAFVHNFVTNPWIYSYMPRRLLSHLSAGAPIRRSDAQKQQELLRTPFYTKEVHPYQAQLILPMIKRIERIGKKIADLVQVYESHFSGTHVQTFLPAGRDRSGMLRYPIAFSGKDRSQILRLALERGVHLKAMWTDEANCEGLPNSRWAARNIIMLPLYTALPTDSAERIARTLLEIGR